MDRISYFIRPQPIDRSKMEDLFGEQLEVGETVLPISYAAAAIANFDHEDDFIKPFVFVPYCMVLDAWLWVWICPETKSFGFYCGNFRTHNIDFTFETVYAVVDIVAKAFGWHNLSYTFDEFDYIRGPEDMKPYVPKGFPEAWKSYFSCLSFCEGQGPAAIKFTPQEAYIENIQ